MMRLRWRFLFLTIQVVLVAIPAGAQTPFVMQNIGQRVETDDGSRFLDMLAWLTETVYHFGRITYHFKRSIETAEKSKRGR